MFVFVGSGDHRDLNVLSHSFPTRRSADLHSDWRREGGDDPDPPRFACDRKGGARCNRRQAPQARRTSRAERTRAGVKEKIMTEAIKLLRIYTDEGAYLGDRRVFEVIASRARDAGLAGVTVQIGRAHV